MESKKPYLSKTIWINLILAVAMFFPPVHAYLSASPEAIALLFSLVNIVLRFVTKKEITWQD